MIFKPGDVVFSTTPGCSLGLGVVQAEGVQAGSGLWIIAVRYLCLPHVLTHSPPEGLRLATEEERALVALWRLGNRDVQIW